MDSRVKSSLAVAALNNADALRPVTPATAGQAGTICHSDRGSHFRSRRFVVALHHHSITGSMGRVGAAGDNAAMESFFALLQKNVLNRKRWATRDELRLAIITWIEKTYHRRRRQARLGRMTPVEFETVYAANPGPRGLTRRVNRCWGSPAPLVGRLPGVRDHGRWRKLMRISRLSAQSSSRVGRMVPGSWG